MDGALDERAASFAVSTTIGREDRRARQHGEREYLADGSRHIPTAPRLFGMVLTLTAPIWQSDRLLRMVNEGSGNTS